MPNISIIDLGSNSMRMSIYRIHGDKTDTILRIKDMVRLSENMQSDMTLKREPIERTISAINNFIKITEKYNCEDTIIIATAAVRKSKNKVDFLNEVFERTGLKINVIDGITEANYDCIGILSDTDIDDCLIMDIGGGSTEIIGIRNHCLENSVSIPMGSRSIYEQFLKQGETENSIYLAYDFVINQIMQYPWIYEYKNLPIIGTGGTLRTVGKVSRGQTDENDLFCGYKVSREDVTEIYNIIKKTLPQHRTDIKGVTSDRAFIILAGLLPLMHIFKKNNSNELIVTDSGVREGILETVKFKYQGELK